MKRSVPEENPSTVEASDRAVPPDALPRSLNPNPSYDVGVTIPEQRPLADRCPGLLVPHAAEDGLLVRLRLPGGQTTVAQLGALSRIAGTFGQGDLQLTSRGNIQIRGIDQTALEPMTEAVVSAGFLPSPAHERVRNIVASPLTGIRGGLVDVRPVVADLDRRLCQDPLLAALPGRFLFAVDDGRGDVTSLSFDLAVRLLSPDRAVVLVGGPGYGFSVAADDAVDTVLALARRFVSARAGLSPPPWHIRELAAKSLDSRVLAIDALPTALPPALGRVGGAAVVQVPLALLTAAQVRALTDAGSGHLVVTPWRGLVLPGAADRLEVLTDAGLVSDETSPWFGISACIGSPGCARSRIDTRQLATSLVGRHPSALPRVHVAGCERRCGSPSEVHLGLVAPASVDDALTQVLGGRA